MAQVIVLMGVSGCGKTAVGQTLAAKLNCPFYDGDDYHPPENVAKMSQEIPLNDDDRHPWLARLRHLLVTHLAKGETAVLACSALKKKYRAQLRQGDERVQFVYLHGSFDLIWQRMMARQGHFMKAEMLRSQFWALEAPQPDEALTVAIDSDIASIVAAISQQLALLPLGD